MCLYDDCLDEVVFFFLADDFTQLFDFREERIGIIFFCSGAFENVKIEVGETRPVEVERCGTVGPRVLQVGAYPVDDGHKVVAYGFYTASTQIGQTVFIVLDEPVSFCSAIFDGFAYGQAFYDRPSQAVRFDIGFPTGYIPDFPDISVRNIVQGGNDTFHTDLP